MKKKKVTESVLLLIRLGGIVCVLGKGGVVNFDAKSALLG